jgi:hypothetical protein
MAELPDQGAADRRYVYAVRVSHRVERTVYVVADTAGQAKRDARAVEKWIDADPIDADLAAECVRPISVGIYGRVET